MQKTQEDKYTGHQKLHKNIKILFYQNPAFLIYQSSCHHEHGLSDHQSMSTGNKSASNADKKKQHKFNFIDMKINLARIHKKHYLEKATATTFLNMGVEVIGPTIKYR